MTVTRTNISDYAKYTFNRPDKDTEILKCIQWVFNDIAQDFPSCRGLEDVTAELALTTSIATLDISSTLSTSYGNQIQKVSLIDSADDNNNDTLDEISFEEYLEILPDPSDPDSTDKGYPERYARREDVLYFYDVPDYTTLSVVIYYGISHPTTGNMLFPDEFEECVVEGVLWKIYAMMEDTKGKTEKHRDTYQIMKADKIDKYVRKPNQEERVKAFF